jgi:hypothetical protein
LKFDSQEPVIGSADGLTDFYMDNLYFSNNTPTIGTPITDFNGAVAEVLYEADIRPEGSDGNVFKVTNPIGTTFSGATFIELTDASEVVDTGDSSIEMRVFSELDNAKVMLKLENSADDNEFVELHSTTASDGVDQWETLTFDVSAVDHTKVFDKASVFFDFGEVPNGETYYFDEITVI